MPRNLRIALAQVAVGPEREDNIQKALRMMAEAAEAGAQLIVFPEMSVDPFFPQYRAEKRYFDWGTPVPGPLADRFGDQAAMLGLAVGSVVAEVVSQIYFLRNPADGRLRAALLATNASGTPPVYQNCVPQPYLLYVPTPLHKSGKNFHNAGGYRGDSVRMQREKNVPRILCLGGSTTYGRPFDDATSFCGWLRVLLPVADPSRRWEVVNCGGIAEKNPLVMQIYADVTGRPMKISRSAQTCALGAAVFGAVVGGAYRTTRTAQKAMTGVKAKVFKPNRANAKVYAELYALYRQLHDAFGTDGFEGKLNGVMKDLIRIRDRMLKG